MNEELAQNQLTGFAAGADRQLYRNVDTRIVAGLYYGLNDHHFPTRELGSTDSESRRANKPVVHLSLA